MALPEKSINQDSENNSIAQQFGGDFRGYNNRAEDSLKRALNASEIKGPGLRKVTDLINQIGRQMVNQVATNINSDTTVENILGEGIAETLENEIMNDKLGDTLKNLENAMVVNDIKNSEIDNDPTDAINSFGTDPTGEAEQVAANDDLENNDLENAANDDVEAETPPETEAQPETEVPAPGETPNVPKKNEQTQTPSVPPSDGREETNPEDTEQTENPAEENPEETPHTPSPAGEPVAQPEQTEPDTDPVKPVYDKPEITPEPPKKPEGEIPPTPQTQQETPPPEPPPENPAPGDIPPGPEINPMNVAEGEPLVKADDAGHPIPKGMEGTQDGKSGTSGQPNSQAGGQNQPTGQQGGNPPTSGQDQQPGATGGQPPQKRGIITQSINAVRNRAGISEIDKKIFKLNQEKKKIDKEIKKINDELRIPEIEHTALNSLWWANKILEWLLKFLAIILALTIVFLIFIPAAEFVWTASSVPGAAALALNIKIKALEKMMEKKKKERDELKKNNAVKTKEIKSLSVQRAKMVNQSMLDWDKPGAS